MSWAFVVEKLNGVIYIHHGMTLVARVTKFGEFGPKIGYNSASTRDMTQNVASNWV